MQARLSAPIVVLILKQVTYQRYLQTCGPIDPQLAVSSCPDGPILMFWHGSTLYDITSLLPRTARHANLPEGSLRDMAYIDILHELRVRQRRSPVSRSKEIITMVWLCVPWKLKSVGRSVGASKSRQDLSRRSWK